jgi:hypothetical protein
MPASVTLEGDYVAGRTRFPLSHVLYSYTQAQKKLFIYHVCYHYININYNHTAKYLQQKTAVAKLEKKKKKQENMM